MGEIYNEFLAFTPVAKSPELRRAVKSAQENWSQLEKLLSRNQLKDRFPDVLDASDKLLEEQ